ncbi:unnamed protein product [Pedinophyceae sp. YPF-701]|nr:unnamed protein product [Pedinophyceae sp. YPF-701]
MARPVQPGSAAPSRYLLYVEYLGSNLCGWQRQRGPVPTVAGMIEEALKKFSGQDIEVVGSSRTDAGVHATGNSCHIDILRVGTKPKNRGQTLEPHSPATVRRALNHFLVRVSALNKRPKIPTSELCPQVAIVAVKAVPQTFHARYSATGRTYCYRMVAYPPVGEGFSAEAPFSGAPGSSFELGRAWRVDGPLDAARMGEAAAHFEGEHDFTSFRGKGCQAQGPVREIFSCKVEEEPPLGARTTCAAAAPWARPALDGAAPQELVVRIHGNGFLYHQVRLMVGLLKEVGSGRVSPGEVKRILDARSAAELHKVVPDLAPACGLYLTKVHYAEAGPGGRETTEGDWAGSGWDGWPP